MNTLAPGQRVGDCTVVFPLPRLGQTGGYYRVADAAGRKRYLRFTGARANIPPEFESRLKHPALLSRVAEGVMRAEGRNEPYLVTEFTSGETLAWRIACRGVPGVYAARRAAIQLLSLLDELRKQSPPVHLGGIAPESVLLCLQGGGPRLLELRPAARPEFCAPEFAAGHAADARSDVYALGILLYLMTFGELPWGTSPACREDRAGMGRLEEERRQPLKFPERPVFELDDALRGVLARALAYEAADRFAHAGEMLSALLGAPAAPPSEKGGGRASAPPSLPQSGRESESTAGGAPRGFAAIAGMDELKRYLTSSVINLLSHAERARRYRIHVPNGMLLYGPPGCGKSFFAEKFAEEVGYGSIYVKASDLASIYVHGSQGKIRELFDKARSKAPTVICFDEFDALVPNRDRSCSHHQYGEVNEFLSQLNNCGQDGIFIIASTNKPDLIDPAVLRRGRIDKKIYLPAPDAEARLALFRLYLNGRPCEPRIDMRRLAELTAGYVCSDIAAIVNEAAIAASEKEELITQAGLEEEIAHTPPSVTKSTLESYETLRRRLESNDS